MPAVVDWGRCDYGEALARMRALVHERRDGRIEDTLILVEHPAVVTIGVEGDDGGAADCGLPVFAIERGGRATYHGPGQLVGYPIVDLDARGRDVRRFVHDVEELVAVAVTALGVPAGRVTGRRGVWVDGTRKVASVGIAIDHWVSFHGFALNVDLDLGEFARIRPCGFDPSVMTSLAHELGRPVAIDEVRPLVVGAWARVFAPPAGVAAAARGEVRSPA
jgi:lipoyl(octanoyl) transferase